MRKSARSYLNNQMRQHTVFFCVQYCFDLFLCYYCLSFWTGLQVIVASGILHCKTKFPYELVSKIGTQETALTIPSLVIKVSARWPNFFAILHLDNTVVTGHNNILYI